MNTNYFRYKKNNLLVEEISLREIAHEYGTPCYVYSYHALKNNFSTFQNAETLHTKRIAYAVKANSNLAILNLLSRWGSSFDIVSGGELERVIAANANPQNIIFSGVAKKSHEIERALEVGIYCFNVESEAELDMIQCIAKNQQKIASIALRINPNIDAKTHPYIATGLHENKFGIEFPAATMLLEKIKSFSNVKLIGIACHIGSQITTLSPFLEALDQLFLFINKNKLQLKHVNIGGGLGITYHQENIPSIKEYLSAIQERLQHSNLEIIYEPGRSIIGNAGVLLTEINFIKKGIT